jgi:hypothetical protein
LKSCSGRLRPRVRSHRHERLRPLTVVPPALGKTSQGLSRHRKPPSRTPGPVRSPRPQEVLRLREFDRRRHSVLTDAGRAGVGIGRSAEAPAVSGSNRFLPDFAGTPASNEKATLDAARRRARSEDRTGTCADAVRGCYLSCVADLSCWTAGDPVDIFVTVG